MLCPSPFALQNIRFHEVKKNCFATTYPTKTSWTVSFWSSWTFFLMKLFEVLWKTARVNANPPKPHRPGQPTTNPAEASRRFFPSFSWWRLRSAPTSCCSAKVKFLRWFGCNLGGESVSRLKQGEMMILIFVWKPWVKFWVRILWWASNLCMYSLKRMVSVLWTWVYLPWCHHVHSENSQMCSFSLKWR